MIARAATLGIAVMLTSAAGSASATSYFVVGKDRVGWARIEGGKFELEYRTFGGRSSIYAFAGLAKRSGSGFALTIERAAKRARKTRFKRARRLWQSFKAVFTGKRSTGDWNPIRIRKRHRVARFASSQRGVLAGELRRTALVLTEYAPVASVVLVVPGLTTNSWNRMKIPYLDENLAAMQAMRLAPKRLKVSTEASVATNAKYIAEAVRREAKSTRSGKVILFGHSKGGTDVTAAMALYPDLAKYVAGVVAVQPVYAGSPVADFAAGGKLREKAVALVFEKLFKGDRRAVLDLSHENRAAFIRKHPYPSKVPTVVIRSTFRRRLSTSVLWANEKLIRRALGKANDGMVTLADQDVPGAGTTITFKNLDHFEPGLRRESPHKPAAITTRALQALFKLMK